MSYKLPAAVFALSCLVGVGMSWGIAYVQAGPAPAVAPHERPARGKCRMQKPHRFDQRQHEASPDTSKSVPV